MEKSTLYFLAKAIILLLFLKSYTYSQSVNNRYNLINNVDSNSYVLCYINPTILSDKDRSTIVKGLLQLSLQKTSLDTIKVKPNENLNLLVKRIYNFWDGEDHETSLKIVNAIKFINNLKNDKIIMNQTLLVPLLPKKPDYINSKDYIQLYDYINDKYLVTKSKHLSNPFSVNYQKVDQTKAGLWTYNLSSEDYKFLLNTIPDTTLKKVYGTALIGSGKPKFIKLNKQSSGIKLNTVFPKIEISSSTKSKIDSLTNVNFGRYTFFDFLDGDCTHGKKVFNVIQQLSNSYGLNKNKLNIEPIKTDYWNNPFDAIKFMEDYFNGSAFKDPLLAAQKASGLGTISFLKNEKKENHTVDEIPEIYFCTLFWVYYSSNPDILATSVWSRVREMSIMPVIFKKNGTNCIAACLDDSLSTVESNLEVNSSADGKLRGAIQPLYYYYNNYLASGFITVGCEVDLGKFAGMYSENGDRVTTLGQGTGWGTDSNSSCIKPNDFGTSFATPEVAFKLYVAKAYWRFKKLPITTDEARIRLILASDLHENFVGKFASGGTPNINKLLTVAKGFIEINDEVNPIEILPGSKIDTDELSGFRFARSFKDWAISGLTFIGDKVFVFKESNPAWKQVTITGINFAFKKNGTVINIKSIDELKNINIKQIVCLTN